MVRELEGERNSVEGIRIMHDSDESDDIDDTAKNLFLCAINSKRHQHHQFVCLHTKTRASRALPAARRGGGAS